MKKIILVLLSAALLAACKKGDSLPKKIFLSKIIVNEHLETEYTYNSEGQLATEKLYDEHSPYALVFRYEYNYDASGNIQEVKCYQLPDNKLVSRNLFTLDNLGRLVSNTYYTPNGAYPGTFNTKIDHEYNKNGRVIKQTWSDEDGEPGSYRNQSYYPNGNMRSSETYWLYSGAPEKVWGSSYGPSDTTLPATFYSIKAYPLNFYYNQLVSSYINHFTYDDGQVDGEWKEIMSDRKFNARGLVTGQKITSKQIIPAGPDAVKTMKYEYVEQ
jgi:hypothetical protein